MAQDVLVLEDLHVGDEKTIVLATNVASGDGAGEPRDVEEGTTFLCYDPDRQTAGSAGSGSSTTLVDADRTEPDDFWVGLPIVIVDASDGREYRTEVTAFVSATHTLTFYALPITVAEGDSYRIEGYPVLPRTDASTSGNEGSIQLTPSDALGTPGRRVLIYHADFGTDSEEVVCTFSVLPSAP
jgi:hypothetical protein